MDRAYELRAIGETLQRVETSLARHNRVTEGLPDLERDRRAQILETRRDQLKEASQRLSGPSGVEPGEVIRRADHVVAEAVLQDVLGTFPDAYVFPRDLEKRQD